MVITLRVNQAFQIPISLQIAQMIDFFDTKLNNIRVDDFYLIIIVS